MNRPAGVSVIAVLSLIGGLLGLCGVTPLLGVSVLGALIPTGVTQVLGAIGIVVSALLLLSPIGQLIFAYGAWNLRPWAWWLGILVTGVSVVGVVIAILGSGGTAIYTALTHALIPIIVFIYLINGDVRRAFNV